MLKIEEMMFSNYDAGEDSGIPWTASRPNPSTVKGINPEFALEGLMLKLQYFGHLLQRADHWKKPRCWERLKTAGEADDRG